jgi:nitrite reductase (NADH) small subunit
MTMTNSTNWISVCQTSDLVDNSGVCALLHGQQIAIFKIKLAQQEYLFAISNWDPIGQANVLYRGIITSVGDKITVASPLYKQRFCLTSGTCLDLEGVSVRIYPIRIEQHVVQLQLVN